MILRPTISTLFPYTTLFRSLMKAPAIKFKDLDAVVTSNIRYNTLPMQVRTDFIRVTDATVYANIAVQFKNSDLNYATKDKDRKSTRLNSSHVEISYAVFCLK